MNRVVVTGGSGFIGREIVALLRARGVEVHLLGRHTSDENAESSHRIDLLKEDPTSLFSRLGPSHLLHLAWYTAPGAFWWSLENLDWVAASLRLARAFSAAGGQRIVIAGSCAEYGWDEDVLNETTSPLKPQTLYGESKAALHQILEKAAPQLGISFASGRVFFPYGPLDHGAKLFSTVVDSLSADLPVDVSEGSQRRNFMHVDDIARSFDALLFSDVVGAVNIATAELTSVRELVELIATELGGADLVRFGKRPLQKGEPPVIAADIRRLTEELRFTPRFSLQTGVRDTIERRLRHATQIKEQ